MCLVEVTDSHCNTTSDQLGTGNWELGGGAVSSVGVDVETLGKVSY